MNITDESRSFIVDHKTAISIELALNKSEYGRAWIHIGDALFDFGARSKPIVELIVTEFQYDYLTELRDSIIVS